MGYPIITKKICRAIREVRKVQKEDRKQYKRVRGARIKGKIYKVVKTDKGNSFITLDNKFQAGNIEQGNIEQDKINQNRINQDKTKLKIEEVLAVLQDNNLEGLSGGGYPTADKIRTLLESNKKQRILIVNGVECDPGLMHDSWLIENKLNDIKQGIKILNTYIGFDRIILATKGIEKREGKVEFKQVPNRYPMGEEHILIEFLLGRRLKKEEIPARHGILTLNVQTVYTLGQIMNKGYKNTERFLTVANLATTKATVVRAPYGMNLLTLLEKIYGKQASLEAYCGEGIMNAHLITEQECVDVHTNFVGYQEKVTFHNQNPCKNCGACTRKCPAQIPVNVIVKAMEQGKKKEAQAKLTNTCLKCGCCTYHCHAGKNVMEIIESVNH
jgi:Na+-translocating ferredoxin:NAD+ oxidoreductase subunit C